MGIYPNTFATQTAGNVPASQLDTNFIVAANAMTAVNVKNSPYNAVGDGVADDTAAIQAALTAAGVNGTVYVPHGVYVVSATLTAPNGIQFIGNGKNASIIYRTGDYGDTLTIGSGPGGLAAGAFRVSGIWFKHSVAYVAGDIALTNKATSGAHLRVACGQQGLIDNCTFWRLPYQIVLDSCTTTDVVGCTMLGVWDFTYAACQEGIAEIKILGTHNGSQILKILANQFSGANSAARSATWGTTTLSQAQNVGSQYGLLNTGCEDLLVAGNYFGGQSTGNAFNQLAAASINLEHRYLGNFFDGAGYPATKGTGIRYDTDDANVACRSVIITGNMFNFEANGFQGIVTINTPDITKKIIYTGVISGNTFNSTVGNSITLLCVNGVIVADNKFDDYNTLNGEAVDAQWVAAVLCDNSVDVLFSGNIVGGQGLYTYKGIAIGVTTTNCLQFANLQTASITTKYPQTAVGLGTLLALATNTSDLGSAALTWRAVYAGTGFYLGADKVVGARDTGWSAMTGAANEAAVYDVATVTLAQIAGRVKAIQDALTTHGLIGA